MHRLTGMAEASVYWRDLLVVDFNPLFGVPAAEAGTAWVTYAVPDLADTMRVQKDRQIGRYDCVTRRGRTLQTPQQAHRHHYVRAKVRVPEWPDSLLAILGPRSAAGSARAAARLDRNVGHKPCCNS